MLNFHIDFGEKCFYNINVVDVWVLKVFSMVIEQIIYDINLLLAGVG